MNSQASGIFAPRIHHDPGSLPPRSPAIPGSMWVPRIIREPFVENALSSRIGRETSIELLSTRIRGFLGCPGEKGESACEFLYRKRQTRYYRLVTSIWTRHPFLFEDWLVNLRVRRIKSPLSKGCSLWRAGRRLREVGCRFWMRLSAVCRKPCFWMGIKCRL